MRHTSVPIAANDRPNAVATADPLLLPPDFMFSQYAPSVKPPRALQPLTGCVPRKLAHSLRFVVPKMIAPACLSRVTIFASFPGFAPNRTVDPEQASSANCVTMLSLSKIGTPCKGLQSMSVACRRLRA